MRVARSTGDVHAGAAARTSSRAVRSLRRRLAATRVPAHCRAGSSLGRRALAQHRRRRARARAPASAPTGPPPRSISARSRRCVMSGSDAKRRCRHLHRIERRGAGSRSRAHGTSPRIAAARLEVVAGDAGAVVEVGERARHPTDAGGAPPGELTVGDQLAPHLVGVGAEREQPRHRARGDVRVLRPRPVGVARVLAFVRGRDPRRDVGRRLAGHVARTPARRRARGGRSGRAAARSAAAGTARVARRCTGTRCRPSRTGTGWSTRPAGTRRGT